MKNTKNTPAENAAIEILKSEKETLPNRLRQSYRNLIEKGIIEPVYRDFEFKGTILKNFLVAYKIDGKEYKNANL
jgi:hypothetical protein